MNKQKQKLIHTEYSLEQKSMEELKLFKPHLEPLIEEMRLLEKSLSSLKELLKS